MSLKIRIGIHCGLVVAGVLGSDARMAYGARGDTMNIAARLQGIAPPGGILVSSDVVNRIGRLFEYGPAQNVIVRAKLIQLRHMNFFASFPKESRMESIGRLSLL